MITEIYGVHDHWRSDRYNWYCVPREALGTYVQRHHLFEGKRDTPILSIQAEIMGGLDNLPICESPSHYRVLVKGQFPDRSSEFVVADCVLLAPPESGCYYKNLSIPAMGDGRFLINNLRDSDSGETEIPFDVLAKVVSYEETPEREFLSIGHSPYANRAIKRLLLSFADGSQQVAYEHSVGYFEGYQYDLFASRKAAYKDAYDQIKALAKKEWTDLECWECGAIYNDPGHVEPGQMGCDRCN